MSAITNTNERDWLRAEVVQKLIQKHSYIPLEYGLVGLGLAGGAIGWGAVEGVGFITGHVNPLTQVVTTLAVSMLSFAGSMLMDYSDSECQQRKNEHLKDYKPWEIVKGRDLSFLLINSNAAFQTSILKKINPSQLNNAIKGMGIRRYKQRNVLEEILEQLPASDSTEDQRRNLEKNALKDIFNNITKQECYLEAYKKCKDYFGKTLSNALEDYLKNLIDHENVKLMYLFSIENNLLNLRDECLDYCEQNAAELILKNL